MQRCWDKTLRLSSKKCEQQERRQRDRDRQATQRDSESGTAGQRVASPGRCDFGSGCREASVGQVWVLEHELKGISRSSRPTG